jgi:DNA polymerase-3 subunit gamma/tau
MAQVTTALANQDGGAVLSLVDDLERNGGSPQHFSRELSRYLRNLLVIRISGADSRLVTASPSERAEMARIAASFTEEDLTRYLQLGLDLFRDLQFSLQPRFHLEIGLLKMVQAGKLISIEDALASISSQPGATQTPKSQVIPTPTPPPARTGPSPFELDRLKKTAPSAPVATPAPSPNDDWRAKLHGALTETGLTFSADAIAQADVALVNNELKIAAPKQFQLDLGRDEILTALKHLGFPALRFKIEFGEVKSPPAAMQKPAAKENEVTERALAHPEVQRFRELFGGEVRTVRNLKEPWNE